MKSNWIGFRTLIKREVLRFFVVASQTLVPPVISSSLFIFVFGLSIGKNIDLNMGDMTYLQYIVPGLVMMHLIEAPYTNTSSSLFISRWHNLIQELLISPLSYFEIVLGLLMGGVARGVIVASLVYGVSLFFVQFPIFSPILMIYFFLMVTVVFACLGLIVGLWAEGFEKLSIWSTFVLTPLIYFGGVFHSIRMVPEPLQFLAWANPIFYFVSGLRYAMVGHSDVDIRLSVVLVFVLAVGLFMLVERLFRIGYKLRS